MKKFLGYFIPIGLAAFLLWFAYRDQDFSTMLSDAGNAKPFPVILTFCTTLFAHWIRALRWNMLFEPLGYQSSRSGSFLAVMSGYFANLLIPRAGELSRCTILSASDDIPLQSAIGTVLAERAFDMLMLILIAMAAFALEYDTLSGFLFRMQEKYGVSEATGANLKLVFAIGTFSFSLFILIFRKKLAEIPLIIRLISVGKGLLDGILSVTKLKKPFLFLLYTVLIWGGYYLTTYFSLWMFDFTEDLRFKAAFMLLIVGSFGIVVPVPGAVGGPFQVFVASALTLLYHKDAAMSITAASVMYWSQVLLSIVAGGICYLLAIIRANQKKKLVTDA
jgi:uncharacterized membrane protein YbhN (UPF0104 family)